ncbi:unnamed protein product [Mycena citricolor]|uniref:RTA1-domain-containing protein n=1 Tax=Mycena citricolor TaxID=2018698 RepID=A0AAD2HNJ3_9AGAR|nr:unnamed protein product [Mycena citricolor]
MTFQHFLTVLTLASSVLAAGISSDTPIGGWVPSKSLSIAGALLYALSAIVLWTQYFLVRPRHRFMLTLTIGMSVMTVGFLIRHTYASPPYTLGKYIAWNMFILLSPCLFLGTDYMLLSTLAATFSPDVVSRCLGMPATRVIKIFVWSDVMTFLLQNGGGGLTASRNPSLGKLGTNIALVGLILQAISFVLFTFLLLTFAYRVSKYYPHIWRPENVEPFKIFSTRPAGDWRILVYIMSFTCVGILTRSVFRIIDYASGYNGYVATHEAFFYLLDAFALWVTMSLYCIAWPTRFLHAHGPRDVPLGTATVYSPVDSSKPLAEFSDHAVNL